MSKPLKATPNALWTCQANINSALDQLTPKHAPLILDPMRHTFGSPILSEPFAKGDSNKQLLQQMLAIEHALNYMLSCRK